MWAVVKRGYAGRGFPLHVHAKKTHNHVAIVQMTMDTQTRNDSNPVNKYGHCVVRTSHYSGASPHGPGCWRLV